MMQPHTLHRNSSRSAKGKGTPSASTPVVKNTTKERAEERANSSTSPSSVTVPSFRNSNCDRPLSVASRWKVVPVSSCAGSSSASLLPPPAQEIPAELCALWGQYGLTMPTAVGYPRPSPILAPAATDTPLRSARTTVGLPVPSRGEGLPACPPTHDLHWNVFFPHGIEQQPPIVLHYLSVGGWRTSAACGDYFTHRRLRHRGDSPGHVARWLFNAHPRNKFVFLIEGVCTPESAAVAEGASLGVVSTREDSHGGDPLGATTGQLDSDHDTTLSSSFDSQPLLPSEDVPSPSMGRLAFAKGFGKGLIGGLRRVRDQVSRLYGSRPAFAMKRPKRRSDGAVTHAAADSVGASSPRRHGKSDASGRGSQHLHEVQGDSPNPNPTNTRDSPNVRLPPSVYSSSVGASPKQGAARVSSMAATSGEAVYKVVEAIEILHEDISALDYTPKLTTSRFTVEAREVHSFIFNSLEDALRYYGSEEAMHQIKAQRSALVSQTVPQHARAISKRHLGKGDSPTEIDQGGEPPRSREQEEMENGGPPAPSRGRSMFFEELPVDPTVDADLSQGSNGEAYASSNGFLHPPRYHATFSDTLVSIYTSDPNFNAVLREVLMPESGLHPYTSSMVAQKRMLALYETGMPSWTMILASTGLPYRRLFRLVYVLIVNVLPVISLLSGCYDLYKHLPQLKRFFARTLEPLTLWIEQRFTLRVSVLSTYLLTVSLTIVTSLQSFLSQFSIINYVLYPFVQLITAIIQLPFVLVFESLRSALLIVLSFVQLAWLSVKVLFVGPFLLISQLAALQGAAAVPVAAVHGTSLTLKWWNAWREFWVTVAAPINNLATAWWNSLMHIVVSASKREASLRRWISPKRELLLSGQIQVWDILEMNARLMFELIVPGWTLTFTMMLLVTYMYWMLLVVPERTKAALLTASQGGTAPSFFGPVTTLVVDDYE